MQDTLGALYRTAELQLVLCRGTRTVAPSGSFLAALQERVGRDGMCLLQTIPRGIPREMLLHTCVWGGIKGIT